MRIKTKRMAAQMFRSLAERLDPAPPVPQPSYDHPIEDMTPVQRELRRWFDDRGDETLRITYPLTAASVVYDVGGYRGQWASDIYSRYLCQVHIFEPVAGFVSSIRHRFANNPHIFAHAFGLASQDRMETMRLAHDRSSAYDKSDGESEVVQLRDVGKVLQELEAHLVDLMKVNIEGGEYELLERLIALGLISRFRNLQIQFHDCMPEAEARMEAIQAELGRTHRITYQYRFVWENWELKP